MEKRNIQRTKTKRKKMYGDEKRRNRHRLFHTKSKLNPFQTAHVCVKSKLIANSCSFC